eukprot:4805757-Prymnesium_polylepis.2
MRNSTIVSHFSFHGDIGKNTVVLACSQPSTGTRSCAFGVETRVRLRASPAGLAGSSSNGVYVGLLLLKKLSTVIVLIIDACRLLNMLSTDRVLAIEALLRASVNVLLLQQLPTCSAPDRGNGFIRRGSGHWG